MTTSAWFGGFDPAAESRAQSALTAASLAFFAMEFEGAPHPPREQVRADFAAAVHGYRAAIGTATAVAPSQEARRAIRTRSEGNGTGKGVSEAQTAHAWTNRALDAEQGRDHAESQMLEAKALLNQLADRMDEFTYQELASTLDDLPCDLNGETLIDRHRNQATGGAS